MSTNVGDEWATIVLDTLDAVRMANGASSAQALVDALASSPVKPWADVEMLCVPEQIGPWSIVQDNGGFVWHVADNVSVNDQLRFHVRPHQTKRSVPGIRRLLLIGESAAGSWGFFGTLSLARLIEVALGQENGECEVLDLSCVNANWRDNCLPMLSAGMTLDPDLVVIFCGNNEARWLLPSTIYGGDSRQADGFQLRWSYHSGDVRNTIELARVAYHSAMEAAVYDTVATCRAFGKPMLFVIPPYNFRNWIPPEQFPVLLEEGQRLQWSNLIEAGSFALKQGEIIRAESLANAAALVDKGGSQRALFLRGCARQQAGSSMADRDFQDAMYAGLGAFVQAVPSLPRPAAQQMANTLRDLDIPALDLSSIFASTPEDEADPLLLDYCHLGRSGMIIAAREIAHAVRPQLWPTLEIADERVKDRDVLENTLGSKVGRVECAVAFVCAALHGHQNGQPSDFVRDWLQRAMRETDLIAPLLQLLQRISCTYYREWLTLEGMRHEGISPDVVDDRSAIFILKFIYHARLDFELSLLIAEVLEDAQPWAEIERQTNEQFQWLGGDLKRMFFMDVRKGFGLFQREMSRREWERLSHDFVATDYKGRVDFFGSHISPQHLFLRISPPVRGLEVRCRLLLNGQLLTELHVTQPHSRLRLSLDSAPFHANLNSLTFEWSRMVGVIDLEPGDARASFVAKFGPYPIAAVISELRFDLDDCNSEPGSHWL